MEQMIIESFKISPALAALVLVVYIFIRSNQWSQIHAATVSKERADAFIETIKEMHSENIAARNRSHDMADRQVVASIELAKVMGQVTIALDKCAGRQQGQHRQP